MPPLSFYAHKEGSGSDIYDYLHGFERLQFRAENDEDDNSDSEEMVGIEVDDFADEDHSDNSHSQSENTWVTTSSNYSSSYTTSQNDMI